MSFLYCNIVQTWIWNSFHEMNVSRSEMTNYSILFFSKNSFYIPEISLEIAQKKKTIYIIIDWRQTMHTTFVLMAWWRCLSRREINCWHCFLLPCSHFLLLFNNFYFISRIIITFYWTHLLMQVIKNIVATLFSYLSIKKVQRDDNTTRKKQESQKRHKWK